MAEFKLQIEPTEKIVFSGKKLGEEAAATFIKITNSLKDRISYKVKCTSNEMFRIRPPVGALKSGESVTVNLVFNAGKTVPDSGKHYFAIYYIKGADEKKAPRALWSEHKGDAEGTKRLYIDFKRDGKDEEEKKEEKEEKKDERKDDKKDDRKDDKKDDRKDDKKDDRKDDKKDDRKEDKKDDRKEDKKDDKKEDKKEEKRDDDKKTDEKEEKDEKKEDKEDKKEEDKKDDKK